MKELDLNKVQSDETLGFCLQNFLGYASHAVQDKAIPNFFDGQLPTQRRYLLAMQDLKAFPGRKTIKSTVAGARMTGWYSPQGNGYGVLVNMSQDYKVQVLLTRPEGNWGEQENFIPAAERYTETALSKFAMEALLKDLPNERTPSDKNPHGIVPTKTNWEGSLLEEEYLPARIPILLINGSSGIAVGIAQNFQPLEYFSLLEQLKEFIKNGSVDYRRIGLGNPTNCSCITSRDEFEESLRTGTGNIRLAARYKPEGDGRTVHRIIITAVPPYRSLNSIGDSFGEWRRSDSKCPFKSFKNESSNSEIRLVLEFKAAERPSTPEELQLRLQLLYKKLSLTTTAPIKMVALKGRYPIQYNVESFFKDWVEERCAIIGRIATKEAVRLMEQKHRFDILLWVRQALDSVVDHIKEAADEEEFHSRMNDLRRLNTKAHESFTADDIKIILGINLKQLSKMNEEEILVKSQAIHEAWKKQTQLSQDKDSQLKQILDDVDYFLTHAETLGVNKTYTDFDPELDMLLNTTVKITRKRPPKGGNPFDQYLSQKTGEIDVMIQSNTGFFMRIPSRSVKGQPMTPKLAMATDSIQHATLVDTTYILFITDNGKLISIMKEDIPLNTPIHWSKIIEMSKINANGIKGINMMPVISDNPTHVMLYLEDGSFKRVPMKDVTSMRASITVPVPVLYAGFIGTEIPVIRKGENEVTTIKAGEIRESSPKRQARIPGILDMGMPTKTLNNLAVNREDKTIYKVRVG